MIRVGGTTLPETRERKARIEDALFATRAAVAEGIVAGGGVALLRAAQSLARLEKKAVGRGGAGRRDCSSRLRDPVPPDRRERRRRGLGRDRPRAPRQGELRLQRRHGRAPGSGASRRHRPDHGRTPGAAERRLDRGPVADERGVDCRGAARSPSTSSTAAAAPTRSASSPTCRAAARPDAIVARSRGRGDSPSRGTGPYAAAERLPCSSASWPANGGLLSNAIQRRHGGPRAPASIRPQTGGSACARPREGESPHPLRGLHLAEQGRGEIVLG